MDIYIFSAINAPSELQERLQGAERLAELLNVTISPELFFDNYSAIADILENCLEQAKDPDFRRVLQKDIKRLSTKRDDYAAALIRRCEKRLQKKIRSRESRVDCEQCLEEINTHFSGFHEILSKKNLDYLDDMQYKYEERINRIFGGNR